MLGCARDAHNVHNEDTLAVRLVSVPGGVARIPLSQ